MAARSSGAKSKNGGEWTEARFNSFIKSGLRSLSQKWPPKYKTLASASIGKRVNARTGRVANHYACNACGNAYPGSEVQVDHINPVIDPVTGFTSWDEVVRRMFCEVEGLQVLCSACHTAKTNAEKQLRKTSV